MIKHFSVLLILFFSLTGLVRSDETVPSMVGVWKGVGVGPMSGSDLHTRDHEDTGVRVNEISVTYTIEKQEGRHFTGTKTTPLHKETVLGSLRPNLRSGIMVDDDGYISFDIVDDNRIDLCYAHTGPNLTSKIAHCYTVMRETGK